MVVEKTHSADYGGQVAGVELGGAVFAGEAWGQFVKAFANPACDIFVPYDTIWYGSDAACIEQVISK